jgi:hypothetical protein
VTGAVHGLQAKLLAFALKQEHVLLVVGPVTRGEPKIFVENVGRDNLREATLAVLGADKLNQTVVDASAVGQPEGRSWGQLVEHQETLMLTDDTVVTLGGLLLEVNPLLEELLVGEGDTVDALQGIVLGISSPVGGGVLGNMEGLDLASVGKVGTPAKINQGAATVSSADLAVGDLQSDQFNFVLVLFEHFESLLLGKDKTLKGLLLLQANLNEIDDLIVLILSNDSTGSKSDIVVESTVLEGRASAEVTSVAALKSLTKNMGRRMPEHLGSLLGLKVEQLNSAVLNERSGQVPHLAVDLHCRPQKG